MKEKPPTPPDSFYCKHCKSHRHLSERAGKYKPICTYCQVLKTLESASQTPQLNP